MYKDFKGQNWRDFNRAIKNKKLFLYGYGELCRKMLLDMERYGCAWPICAVIDTYKAGEKINANFEVECRVVKEFEYLSRFNYDEIAVLICTIHVGEIAKKLYEAGIENYYSVLWMDTDQAFYERKIQDDIHKVNEVKNLLHDDKSKEVLDAIVEKRSKGFLDYSDIKSFYDSEYFIDEFWKPEEEEVFIDGGAYDGDTIEEFCEWTKGNFRHIYSFEPQKDKYDCIVKKMWKYGDKLTLFNKGIWSKDTLLDFHNGNEKESGRIVEEKSDTSIEMCSLDETIHEKVTFIKMDIEGAEIEAIKGAKRLITTYKPKLAICIYHKPEDLLEIPKMIHEMVPEYKLYIRQNGAGGCYGTVLYAYIEKNSITGAG